MGDPHGRLLAIRRSQESGKLAFPFNFPHVSKAFVNAVLRKLPKRLGAGEGGADKLKAHPMFRAVKFDWSEFEARRLRAPFSKEWDETAAEEEHDVDMPVDLYGCSLSTEATGLALIRATACSSPPRQKCRTHPSIGTGSSASRRAEGARTPRACCRRAS